MHFVIVILIIALIFNVRKADLPKECLSITYCNSSKAVFAGVVVFHHMAKILADDPFAGIFLNLGYLAVSVFFIISGYGLMVKYSKGYPRGYMIRKVLWLIVEYAIVNILYILWEVISSGTFNLERFKQLYVTGICYADNSWYIIAIIVIYIAFDLVMRFTFSIKHSDNNKLLSICIMTIFFTLYTVFVLLQKWGSYWYISCGAFIIGMLIAVNTSKIVETINKKWLIHLTIQCFIFMISQILLFRCNLSWLSQTALKAMAAIAFAVIIITIGMRASFSGKAITWVSSISLEIYMLHGLSFRILRNDMCCISNDLLFCLLSIIICLILSCGVNNLIRLLKGKVGVFYAK